jgi:hypothetical protein
MTLAILLLRLGHMALMIAVVARPANARLGPRFGLDADGHVGGSSTVASRRCGRA